MKKIIKNTEPSSLTRYRSEISRENLHDSNIYEDFSEKNREDCVKNVALNLRKQLLEEHGYICCYCMSRISCKNSKIEHFKPQTHFRGLQIDYQNLFISCKGAEGSKGKEQHCDTKKGEEELVYINLLGDVERQIIYEKESRAINIKSSDTNIDNELNSILNLNNSILQKNRKETYSNVIKNLQKKGWSVPSIKKVLEYNRRKHQGKFEPFSEMVVYFLSKKLKSQGVQV